MAIPTDPHVGPVHTTPSGDKGAAAPASPKKGALSGAFVSSPAAARTGAAAVSRAASPSAPTKASPGSGVRAAIPLARGGAGPAGAEKADAAAKAKIGPKHVAGMIDPERKFVGALEKFVHSFRMLFKEYREAFKKEVSEYKKAQFDGDMAYCEGLSQKLGADFKKGKHFESEDEYRQIFEDLKETINNVKQRVKDYPELASKVDQLINNNLPELESHFNNAMIVMGQVQDRSAEVRPKRLTEQQVTERNTAKRDERSAVATRLENMQRQGQADLAEHARNVSTPPDVSVSPTKQQRKAQAAAKKAESPAAEAAAPKPAAARAEGTERVSKHKQKKLKKEKAKAGRSPQVVKAPTAPPNTPRSSPVLGAARGPVQDIPEQPLGEVVHRREEPAAEAVKPQVAEEPREIYKKHHVLPDDAKLKASASASKGKIEAREQAKIKAFLSNVALKLKRFDSTEGDVRTVEKSLNQRGLAGRLISGTPDLNRLKEIAKKDNLSKDDLDEAEKILMKALKQPWRGGRSLERLPMHPDTVPQMEQFFETVRKLKSL